MAQLSSVGTGPDRRESVAPAVTRAAGVLQLLAARPKHAFGISEIARELQIPKSSTSNICVELATADLIRRTDLGYQLGPALALLGAAYVSTVDQVRDFHEACERFAGHVEPLQLAVLTDGPGVLYLARYDGDQALRLVSDVGRRLPASHTATGKAILASLSDDELQEQLGGVRSLPTPTERSLGSVRELLADLEATRRRGYALDDEETVNGLVCVAAVVPGTGDEPSRCAVSHTMLKSQATEDHTKEVVPIVRRIASEIGVRSGAVRA